MSQKNLGPIGSAVLTFIGYRQTDRQTDRQTNKQTDKQAKFIYRRYKTAYVYTWRLRNQEVVNEGVVRKISSNNP